MTDFSSYIGRSDASSYLLPDEYSREIMEALPTQSKLLGMMRQLPPLSSKTYKIPMLNAFPSAYFVDEKGTGSNFRKQVTKLAWSGVTMYVEEMAVIVPVPENVVEDMAAQNYDLWGMVRPRMVEAIGALIDQAILYNDSGNVAPSTWPDGIVTAAVDKGNTVSMNDVGDSNTFKDVADAIAAGGGLFAKVEEDGYIVNGAVAGVEMMGMLRGLRTSDGQFIFLDDLKEAANYRLLGVPIQFMNNGAWDNTKGLLVVGDFTQAVYGIRQDITWKVATEASIHDSSGNLVFNLFQDDMVALRVTMRMGWALPNPKNRMNQTDNTRFPFAVLTPASP